jgi:heptosyltransferase II
MVMGSSGTPSRVLVFAPNWLGDAVMALPAIADVRRRFEDARLVVAARRSVADLFRMVPLVDEVLPLQWRGRLWRSRGFRADMTALRSARADVGLLLPNSFASAWLMMRAGVSERWGYATDMRGWLLSRPVARPADRMHQAEYYQRLVRGLGIENGPLEPVLAVPAAAQEAARQLLASRGWDGTGPLVVAAPGAAYGNAKRWPPAHFARLLDHLVTERRATCVLAGSEADAEATARVRASASEGSRRSIIDLAGRTTLEELAGIMSVADACVSNDSGAMHLAAAAGVPLAAIFGPTNERETAPLVRRGRPLAVLINPVSCRPCMLRECPIDHRCMAGLEPAVVASAVGSFLER